MILLTFLFILHLFITLYMLDQIPLITSKGRKTTLWRYTVLYTLGAKGY